MRGADSRSMMLVLRALFDGEDGDRNAEWVAEYVIEQPLSGHFGFFTLLLDMVDGKLHQTAGEELTFEADYVLVVADDRRDDEMAEAA